MATAILVDGGYFLKRLQRIDPDASRDAQRSADLLFRWSLLHLHDRSLDRAGVRGKRELYRIFFYDCPPVEKKMHHPLSGQSIDFAKTGEAQYRRSLHQNLREKRKVALRLGHLSPDVGWTIKPNKIKELLGKRVSIDELQDQDVVLSVRQKGVDMKIGVDVTSLTLKQQVDQIVLIAGDADFVPAAKIARREGIDFVLDPMWKSIPPGLQEHIDGLRTTCPRPTKKAS